MANLFGPGGLLGSPAPGVSPVANPLAMLGLGIYQGNPADALANMGNLQQAGAQLQLQQQMHQNTLQQQERERRRRQALASAMSGAYAGQPQMQAIAQNAPSIMAQHYLSSLAGPTPTSLQKNLNWAMSLPEDDPRRAIALQSIERGGINVNVGGAGEFGRVPQAMARVPDATSPTGTRLIEEPGSPAIAKREAEKDERVASLDNLEDSLNRYRATLRTYGPEIMAGEGKLRLSSTYNDLTMRRKEADELGALTGPDLDLLESAIVNPTGLTAQYYEKTGQVEALFSQLDQAQKAIDDARARAEGREPEPPKSPMYTQDNPATVTNDDDYDDLAKGDYYIGPDGVLRVK